MRGGRDCLNYELFSGNHERRDKNWR
jgi:hypothetical protein